MTAGDRFELVPFGERQILTVKNDDGVFVVMKPIVEALGLQWEAQLKRLRRHPALSKGMSVMDIPSAGGVQEAAALRLEQFHGWLVTLHPDRVADAGRRAVIIEYQERAFRAVFDHFHGPVGQAPPALPAGQRVALQNQVLRLVRRLQTTRHRVERQLMHTMIGDLCTELSLATPPLDRLGHQAPDTDEIVQHFWACLDQLRARDVAFDHSRTPERIAFSMLELRRHFRTAGIACEVDITLRKALQATTRFIDTLTVNSKLTGSSKHCWVFRADG